MHGASAADWLRADDVAGVSCFHCPQSLTSVNGVIVHHSSTAAVILACGLLLAGCSAESPGIADQPATGSVQVPDEHGPGDDHEPIPAETAQAAPTWDAAASLEATDFALAVMAAYARPDLAAGPWYEQLAGYLTPAGQEAFYGTDLAPGWPRQVISARSVEAPSVYLATVTVGTDAGTYAVQLVRGAGGAGWLADRISPLEPGE